MERQALGYIMRHVAGTMSQQANQILQEQLGIGMAQFKILSILQQTPQARQRTLAGHLGQTEASISRQIKLLTDKGMLAARINPKNRREHQLLLTPKGAKLLLVATDLLQQYQAPLFGQLNDKQYRQLLETLQMLHQHVCQPGKFVACNHAIDAS